MPWFHASWSFGTVAGSAVGAAAAFAGIDVALHLGVIGVVQIVGAVLVIRWIPTDAALAEQNGDETPVTFRERMSIWLNPRTLLIGLLVLGMAFTEGSANDWIAIGFIDDRGFDNGQGALMFGVFTVAMTVGRLAGVPLLDRFGRVPVLRGAALAAAVGLAIVILVPIIPLAVVGVVLWGLGASLGFPVGMSAAADDPRTAAASVSAVATVGYAAFLIGPPLIGFVGEHIGVLNALWIVLGLIIIATLAIPRGARAGARRSRASAPGRLASLRRDASASSGALRASDAYAKLVAVRLVVARCSVDYAGRLSAHLPLATRLLVLKNDGSVLVHSDSLSYKPLNWMSPPAVFTLDEVDDERAEAGVIELWRVTHAKTADLLVISIHEILHDSQHELGVDPGLQKDGVEADLQRLLAEQIELLGDGPHARAPRVHDGDRAGRHPGSGCRGRLGRGRDQAARRHRRRRAADPLPRADEPRPGARPGHRRVRGAGDQAAGAHAGHRPRHPVPRARLRRDARARHRRRTGCSRPARA